MENLLLKQSHLRKFLFSNTSCTHTTLYFDYKYSHAYIVLSTKYVKPP